MISARPLILIVEDEPAVAELVRFSLAGEGWDCCAVPTVGQAWDFILSRRPQLVILDWMLRGQSGLHLLLRIRRERQLQQLPVVMLSGRTGEQDRIDGLNSGADAYVTKPFSPRELFARAKALLRLNTPQDGAGTLRVGAIVLDEADSTVRIGEQWVAVGAVELRLLHFLLAHPGEVFTRRQLLGQVWQGGGVSDERSVDVVVLRLRKAMGEARSLVRTVRGAGYMLAA
jgi:two-component system phosphate regulon response regulator PhoB